MFRVVFFGILLDDKIFHIFASVVVFFCFAISSVWILFSFLSQSENHMPIQKYNWWKLFVVGFLYTAVPWISWGVRALDGIRAHHNRLPWIYNEIINKHANIHFIMLIYVFEHFFSWSLYQSISLSFLFIFIYFYAFVCCLSSTLCFRMLSYVFFMSSSVVSFVCVLIIFCSLLCWLISFY